MDDMAQSPSERTPLFGAQASRPAGVGEIYRGIPGGNIEDGPSTSREGGPRGGFGEPTTRERIWYKAKQFRSLLISLTVCSIIAVLIIVAVVASHNNVNPAFPGEVNSVNNSGPTMLTSTGAHSSLMMTSKGPSSNPQTFISDDGSEDPEDGHLHKTWILRDVNITERDLMDALNIGRQHADRLRSMVTDRNYKAPSLNDPGLKPDDLYRAAKTGFDISKLRNYTGYAVDAATSHVVTLLGLTKEQAMDMDFWEKLPPVGSMIGGWKANSTFIKEHNSTLIKEDNRTYIKDWNATEVAAGNETSTMSKMVNVTEQVVADVANKTKEVINKAAGTTAFNTTDNEDMGNNATTYGEFVYGVGSFNCSADEKYRRIDGICNNLQNPWWGAAGQAYRRLLAPEYDDGVTLPRETSSDGVTPLPGPRVVSRTLHRSDYREEPGVSMLFVMWGQFLDHDMEASVNLPGGIDCCADMPDNFTITNRTNVNVNATDVMHPECFPILIDDRDYFYGPKNVTCINLVRDAVAPSDRLGPRQQMNANTAFIDGSMVYGSSEGELKRVRGDAANGTLVTAEMKDGRKMLPWVDLEGCSTDTEPSEMPRCHFGAGDSRAEENMGLTSFHTLLAREHNNVASALSKLNPKWDSEKLFQEARRIVIAEIQHITDNEYLPILLGRNWDSHTGKKLSGAGFFSSGLGGYQEDLDPTISNVFAGAAFRFGHSMVQGLIKMLTEGQTVNSEENIPFHEMQFNTSRMYGPGQMDGLIRGYSRESSRRSDRFFTSQLTNHLFETRDSNYGLDLVSINIQRGRDRGLPSYNAWREYCSLPKLTSFADLDSIGEKGSAEKFQTVYKSVDDIDPYSGMMAEKRAERSLLGPTLRCLLSEQFYRLKHGDRFWYDSPTSPNPFTKAQLDEIKKTTLAGIICRNSDNIKQISRSPMLISTDKPTGWFGKPDNRSYKKVSCNTLPSLQFLAWEEYNMTAPAVLTKLG